MHHPRDPRCPLRSCLLACATTLARVEQAKLTKQDATRFQVKLAQIEKNAVVPRKGAVARNDGGQRRRGQCLSQVSAPAPRCRSASSIRSCTARGADASPARAVVDLDAVRTQKKRAWTDPMGYLTGRLPVTAAGTLSRQNGVGRFRSNRRRSPA